MVSTSIPTLSIAAISSAKAQTHTEYYNTKHGKIATDDQFGHFTHLIPYATTVRPQIAAARRLRRRTAGRWSAADDPAAGRPLRHHRRLLFPFAEVDGGRTNRQ